MKMFARLCGDEAGAVLSSELVLVGTLGVISATVGLKALSTALNEELEDVAFAIRSLDQSYAVAEVRGCGAYSAGSSFTQEPVKESLRELDEEMDRHEQQVEKRWKEVEQQFNREHKEMEKQPAKQLEKKPAPQPEKKPEMKKPDAKAPEAQKPDMKKPDAKKPGKKKKNQQDEEVLL